MLVLIFSIIIPSNTILLISLAWILPTKLYNRPGQNILWIHHWLGFKRLRNNIHCTDKSLDGTEINIWTEYLARRTFTVTNLNRMFWSHICCYGTTEIKDDTIIMCYKSQICTAFQHIITLICRFLGMCNFQLLTKPIKEQTATVIESFLHGNTTYLMFACI